MFFKRVIAFFWIDTPILGLIASFFSLIITKGKMELVYTYMPILMIFQYCLVLFKDIPFTTGSIGKKLVGLQIVNQDGSKPSRVKLFLRNILFPLMPIDAFIVALTDQKIMDRILKLKVVNTEKNILNML